MKYATLRVLAWVADDFIAALLGRIVVSEGETFELARDADDALSRAAAAPYDVALVSLERGPSEGLGLVHHLSNVSPTLSIYVLVSPDNVPQGAEALSLGAAGLLMLPLTGDAVVSVLASVKTSIARADALRTMRITLERERQRVAVYERLVRDVEPDDSDSAVQAVEATATWSGAEGVALYMLREEAGHYVRYAAVGTALALFAQTDRASLLQLENSTGARVLSLRTNATEFGILVLERTSAIHEPDLERFTNFVATLIAMKQRTLPQEDTVSSRFLSAPAFQAHSSRLLGLAHRHERRASVLVIRFADDAPIAHVESLVLEIADELRLTDVLTRPEPFVVHAFLPETSGIGAHSCRRRVLARALGDRRTRAIRAGAERNPSNSTAVGFSVGFATYPADGKTVDELVQIARVRAFANGGLSSDRPEANDPVFAEGADAAPTLSGLVDGLLARPSFGGGMRSTYPIDIALPSLFALVGGACREAARAGAPRVTTTFQPGLSAAAAARLVPGARVIDARKDPDCATIEAIVVDAEHGAWACCGRVADGRFRGVHCADTVFADVLTRRLLAAGHHHAP